MNYEIKAHAKVNLHLEVLNKRDDNYHNLFGFNASLELCDILTFNKISVFDSAGTKNNIEIIPAGGTYAELLSSIKAEENLITKAATAYLNAAGKNGNISISVLKNIPSGAGLGGGSSDAAAVLRMLNSCLAVFSEEELLTIASSTGADVPYCLTRGFAICSGTGNIIEPVQGRLNYPVLVIDSGIHIDTARAYSSLNKGSEISGQALENIEITKIRFKKGLENGDIKYLARFFKNDFEATVFSEYPVLKTLKEELLKQGALFAGMTGSGSGLIGIFSSRNATHDAEIILAEKARVFITEFTL